MCVCGEWMIKAKTKGGLICFWIAPVAVAGFYYMFFDLTMEGRVSYSRDGKWRVEVEHFSNSHIKIREPYYTVSVSSVPEGATAKKQIKFTGYKETTLRGGEEIIHWMEHTNTVRICLPEIVVEMEVTD